LARAVLKEDWPKKAPVKPIVLPYASLGSLFKGREAFLQRLRERLTREDGGRTAIVSKALYGMGGIGKTRAAVEYAWACREDYTALLFVQADSPQEFRRNMAGLAGPLLLPEREAAEEEVRLNAVLAWLAANPGWLLILDNIDTPDAVVEVDWLLGRLLGGHVLLTSRLDRFARQVEPLELDVLTLDAAAGFLLEATEAPRHKAADDDVAARKVADELGRLALALEQAAATIEKLRCGFRRYLEAWQSNREKVVGWARPEINGYHHAVAATWHTSVDQLSEAGRHLLERLSFLAPDPVPMFLLDVPVPHLQGEDLRDALGDLMAVSLATLEITRERFTVHRLVQDVTRRSLDEATSRHRVTEALGWVNAAFTGDPNDVRTWVRLDPLAPHAQSISQWADMAGIVEPTTGLMNELGQLSVAKSLYPQAEPLMRRALAIAEASFGADHPEVAIRLTNLAHLLQETNRAAEGEPLCRRALEIGEAKFGPDHPTVAIFLNNLAELLRVANRLPEAEPFYRRALTIAEASLGRDHPDVAICLNNLALLLRATNRAEEAEPHYRRALAIDEASFGPNHPEVATDLNNLARLLQATRRIAEAEPLMRRALAINETSLGPDHPDVGINLSNLARLLQATNRMAEAELLMRRHLAILIDFERKTGHPHPHRDAALSNYTGLLAEMGKGDAEIKTALAALRGESGE
jgi:tetratricopeptide (TPR) repeat protein